MAGGRAGASGTAAATARRIGWLVAKDLRRRRRAPLGYLVVLSFPLVFAALLGLTFGGGGAAPRLRLLVENHDDGVGARFLVSALTAEEASEFLDVEVIDEEEAGGGGELPEQAVDELLETSGAAALLRIPAGFTAAVLDGEPTALTLVRNPAQGILPEAAEQLAGLLTEGLDAASRALRGPLEQLSVMSGEPGAPAEADLVAMTLAIRRTLVDAEGVLFPPVLTLDAPLLGEALETAAADGEEAEGGAEEEEDDGGPTGMAAVFALVLPGVSVFALFLIGDLGMRDLLVEARLGTLTRQLAGPVGPGTLLAAKTLGTAVLASVSLGLMAVLGALLVGRAVDPAGFLALSFALLLAVTGAAATIYGSTGEERRGATVASVVYLVLAFAGGAFGGEGALPAAVRGVAPLSPFYWGARGFEKLLGSGAGLVEVLPHVAVLGALGAVLTVTGTLLLKRRVARGVVR
jgi:ABC-2 type transport system permease protein